MQEETVIVYGKRTPIGRMSGSLSEVSAPKLAATLVGDALNQLPIAGSDVDEALIGNVLSAGVGQAPARQAAIYGGLPASVRATTINRVCGSGLKAVMLGDQAIRLGESRVVFAGGMENMSLAPHLLMNARRGFRFGAVEAKDHMQWDGLWDPYSDQAMGNCGELCARHYKFSRDEQDAYSIESYERARQAVETGHFSREIVEVTVPGRRGDTVVAKDEEPFAVDLDKLPKLRPAFAKDGTITAGNASSIDDGAALTVLVSANFAKERSLKPLARIVAQASHAADPTWFTTAPVECIRKVLAKAEKTVNDIDIFEINEAFAVVPMAAMRELEIPRSKVCPHGGAVALGHPIGASGTRVLVTLINGLQTAGKKWGLATLCIGGGEASAVVIELL